MKNIFGSVSKSCISIALAGAAYAENFVNYGGEIYSGANGSWVGGVGAYQTFSVDSGNVDGNGDTIYSQTGARTQMDDHILNLSFNSWGGVSAGTPAAGTHTTELRGGQHVVNNRDTTDLFVPTSKPFGNTKHRVNGISSGVDGNPDSYQFRLQEDFLNVTDLTYGAPNYGLAFTPHVQKSGFLLGGDSGDTLVAFNNVAGFIYRERGSLEWFCRTSDCSA